MTTKSPVSFMKKKLILLAVSTMLIFGTTTSKALILSDAYVLESSINDLGSSMMESSGTVKEKQVQTFTAKKKKVVVRRPSPPKPVTKAS